MAGIITKDCRDCGVTFDITEKEQNWYKEKGFELPTRCSKCRSARRSSKKGAAHGNKRK